MTSTERHGLWIGGLILAAAAVGGVVYAVTSKPAAAATPAGVVFQPGRNYLVSAPIPTGTTTAAAIQTQLTAMGFTNVQVAYFGPQGVLIPSVTIPFTVGSTTYVASGTYSGTQPMSPPAGMSVVAL